MTRNHGMENKDLIIEGLESLLGRLSLVVRNYEKLDERDTKLLNYVCNELDDRIGESGQSFKIWENLLPRRFLDKR